MDVTYQFEQVRVLFAQDGFIAVLEKMPPAMVPEIITDGVPRQEPPHDGGQGGSARSEQKVKVVGNQCPRIAACLGLTQNSSQAIEKIIAVSIAKEDLLPSDPTPDDMMQCVWGIYPSLSRHGSFLSHSAEGQVII
jgi:hypothetical protein